VRSLQILEDVWEAMLRERLGFVSFLYIEKEVLGQVVMIITNKLKPFTTLKEFCSLFTNQKTNNYNQNTRIYERTP
jgi:hypothetical protein